MATRTDTRRRNEGYSNKMMGLKLHSEGGSVSGVSQTGFSQSGSQKTSSSLEYMKPPDTSFDVKAGELSRRPASPTSSAASFSNRRSSRPGGGILPLREALMQADIEHDEADHEDDAEIRRQAAGGVFGLIGNVLEGAGGKKVHGLEAANAPVVLPDKRDPNYKTTILKYLYSQNPSLTTLDMSDCALTDGDMPRLCDALASSTTVRSLTLATNSLTHESMEDFIQALQLNESIRSIDFGENAMGVRGATTFARILADKENLIGLDLSSNLIRDEGCRAVLDSVMQTPGQPIMWLSVSENCISDQSAADIASLLDIAKNLTYLDVSRNAFFSNGMRVIAEELGLNVTLKHLNLSFISLSTEASELLANSLAKNRGLLSLDLYSCNVGDVGAEKISVGLAYNTALRRLDLGSNQIGAPGCAALADGVGMNSTLHVLRLWGNNMNVGVERLVKALEVNDTLTDLDLTGCSGNEVHVALIGSLVKKNRQTNVSHHKGDSQISALKKALAREQKTNQDLYKQIQESKKNEKIQKREVVRLKKMLSSSQWGGAENGGSQYDSMGSTDEDNPQAAATKTKNKSMAQEKPWWDVTSLTGGLPGLAPSQAPASNAGLPTSFAFFGNNNG